MRFAIVLVGLAAVGTFLVGDARALDIQVAPQMLVVSSGGSNLTIHTDSEFIPNLGDAVTLEIAPEGRAPQAVFIESLFADDCGNLVARCNRLDAADAVGEFEGKQTTATVILTILGDSGEDVISVKK